MQSLVGDLEACRDGRHNLEDAWDLQGGQLNLFGREQNRASRTRARSSCAYL